MTEKSSYSDRTSKAVGQYRKLAHQAKLNADSAANPHDRDWFLALAKTLDKLVDVLEEQLPTSD